MLEEKNDNLLPTDGQELSNEQNTHTTITEEKTIINTAQEEIDNSNAEENEDDSIQEKHTIPMLDYESLPMPKLVEELEQLVTNNKIMAIKEHVEEIKKSFTQQYNQLIKEKKEEFIATSTDDDGDTTFSYHFPLKDAFEKTYNDYRKKRNKYYSDLQNNLKYNLEKRNQLIENLKNLVDTTNETQSIGDKFNQLNEIREQWKTIGNIPRDEYNIVWNNYHFHMERFYDLIHLDREARDKDFKINLEEKQNIIAKAKALLDEEDVPKAFRKLQLLHRTWKEKIGPIAKEHRENVWNEFSNITKQIHDKREVFLQYEKEKEKENLVEKNKIIAQIEALTNIENNSHNAWQKQIKNLETIREQFYQAGRVPKENTTATWDKFKTAVRLFNTKKNTFYKDLKKQQQTNLNKKMALIAKANELKDSTDFETATPVMKEIQNEWKKIGHVPRKVSDKIWNEFRKSCNHYFNRFHEIKNAENKEEIEAYNRKKEFLTNLKEVQLVGEHKSDLKTIKEQINTWKTLGQVPYNKRHIDGKFHKVLDALFEKLDISRKESELMKFDAKLEEWTTTNDHRSIEREQYFVRKKIDEIQHEIIQLENNVQFITNAKNDNPFLKEVKKNIDKHHDDLKIWKMKLTKLREVR